jgi:hypothetical protein
MLPLDLGTCDLAPDYQVVCGIPNRSADVATRS